METIDRTIDITAEERDIILELLERYLPGTTAWIYDLREKCPPTSKVDLNLVVFSSPEQKQAVSNLQEALKGNNFPFRADLIDWNDLLKKSKYRARDKQDSKQLRSVSKKCCSIEDSKEKYCWTTLGECAMLVRDTVLPSDLDPMFPYIGLKHIGKGTLSLLNYGLAKDTVSNKFRFQRGDILFGKLRPYFRKVIRAKFDGVCSTDIWVVRSSKKVDTGYLYYLLASQKFIDETTQGSTGTRMPRAQWDYVSRFGLLLPPLFQQCAIAHVLGTLDDKIQVNRQMNKTLDAMSRTLFKSWFIDFEPVRAKMEGRNTSLPEHIEDLFPDRLVDSELGEIPEGWKVKPLDAIAQFQNGLALQKHQPEKGQARLPVVKIAQLRTGRADSEEWASATIKPECILSNGDIVFSWSGSLLVHIWCGGPAALNQHLFKVTSNKFPKWFYWHCVLIHLENFQHIARGKATTMGHIKRHHLSEALCVVPPDSAINSMTHIFDTLLKDQIANEIESHTLIALRDTLLPKLVSGKIRFPGAGTAIEAQA